MQDADVDVQDLSIVIAMMCRHRCAMYAIRTDMPAMRALP